MVNMIVKPYILLPRLDSIIIAWEMNKNIECNFLYEEKNSGLKNISRVEKIVDKDNILYCVCLKNLKLKSRYTYSIFVDNNLEFCSEFNTFNFNDEIKIFTISDTHSFPLHSNIIESINKHNPDFIIHSGDISQGTGDEKYQYIKNWFNLIPNVLSSVPVCYVPGNHDCGKYFQYYFIDPIKKFLKQSVKLNFYSINYKNTHFMFLDSNPWGLEEMNAVNSNFPLDEIKEKNILDTLYYLEEDLKQIDSEKIKWKVLVLHHPYTDLFTNKYIPYLVNKYGIDLIISGHIHYYTKVITINDKKYNSIYISQGSLEKANATLEKQYNKRLFEEFYEVVSKGNNNFGVLSITKNKLKYNIYGYDNNFKEKNSR